MDQLVSINIDRAINYFVNANCDGGLVTFNSRNPRWSYAMITNNKVQQTAEKNPISNNAIAGIYYFKDGLTFMQASFLINYIKEQINQKENFIYPAYIMN